MDERNDYALELTASVEDPRARFACYALELADRAEAEMAHDLDGLQLFADMLSSVSGMVEHHVYEIRDAERRKEIDEMRVMPA